MAEKSSRCEAEVINHPPGCMNPKGPLLTLVVGPERKIISTHRELLIRHSEVFRNALAGPWAEATASVLELPDSDPEIVENFIIWARSGLMLGPKFALELYVWADKYQVLLLKTDAAHTLYRHWTTCNRRTRTQRIAPEVIPDAKIIHFALNNLPENDRIIQLIRVVHALWECRLSDRHHAAKKQIVVHEAVPEAEIIHFAINNLSETNRILQLLRVVLNLWDGQGVDQQQWVQMRLAKTRLFQTGPNSPVDRIRKEHV
ncbi:hypothetical protein IWX90DRAFT_491357 [Phyllosticta citrichinensis]|uniref:BTB domain-containing protein n=1 Tax=Phyllosticta citrichinensis TaxID=1130410 RepID=A0ABR1Y5K1_9PEZI